MYQTRGLLAAKVFFYGSAFALAIVTILYVVVITGV